MGGTGIDAVMKDAGLTHGAFYAHFGNKDDMLVAAFRQALVDNRPRWTKSGPELPWPQRLEQLAERYLTRQHRDDLSASCALAALLSDAGRSNDEFRRVYEEELLNSLDSICGDNPCDAAKQPGRFEDAVMLFALCVGGISLSRAVEAPELSDRILAICQKAASRIAGQGSAAPTGQKPKAGSVSPAKEPPPSLDLYTFKTFDKIRYADTDRQGHVNNAVFSTMLETGRTEILFNPEMPLAAPGCSFVIANLNLNFLAQVTWPGRVDIGTRIMKVSRSSVVLDTAVFTEAGVCAARAQTIIVHISDETQRSQAWSEPVRQYLNGLAAQNPQLERVTG